MAMGDEMFWNWIVVMVMKFSKFTKNHCIPKMVNFVEFLYVNNTSMKLIFFFTNRGLYGESKQKEQIKKSIT